MRRVLRILFIASMLVCFILFLNATDIDESIRLLYLLGSNGLLLLVITFASYLSGTLGWRFCLDTPVHLPLSRLFMIRHTGNMITVFNPAGAVAGEFFNARRLIVDGVSEREAYKSVLLGRILMILSQLFLFLIVLLCFLLLPLHRYSSDITTAFYILLVSFFVRFVSIFILLLKKRNEVRLLPQHGRWEKTIYRIEEMRILLGEYMRRRPKETGIAFLFFSLQWMLASLELFFILYFLKFNISLLDALFLDTVIILLKSAVAFIPGQLGVEELINKFTLSLLGMDAPGLWLSVSILRRSRQLFWSGVALLFYLKLKRDERQLKTKNIVLES